MPHQRSVRNETVRVCFLLRGEIRRKKKLITVDFCMLSHILPEAVRSIDLAVILTV